MNKPVLKWTVGIILLLLMIVGVGFWQLKAREALRDWDPEKARKHNRPIPVRTITVKEEQAGGIIGSTAVTMPSESATLAVSPGNTEIAARQLKRVNVAEGAVVYRHQVLFEFESKLFQLSVAERQSEYDRAETDLAAYRKLFEKNATSELELRTAEQAVQTAALKLALAEQDLKDCEISSPIFGIADRVTVTPGMHLNNATNLVTIHNLDPIHLEMDYPIERLDSLELGQVAEVVLDSFPEEVFQGKVVRIAPVASTRTRVLPVVIEVPNLSYRIKAGISGFVRIATEGSQGLSIPQLAIIKQGQKAMVFTVEADRVSIREVVTGEMTRDGKVEILSGLETGEQVVIFGQDSLQENDLVNTNWREWARR